MNKKIRLLVLAIGTGLLVTLGGCHSHSGYYAGYTYYGNPYVNIDVSHLSYRGHYPRYKHGYKHRHKHGYRPYRFGRDHHRYRGFRHGSHHRYRGWR